MQSKMLITFLLPLNFRMMLPLFIWGLFFYSIQEFCTRNLPRQDIFLLCLAWPYKVDCKTVRELSTENHEASASTNFSFACQASYPSRLLLLQTFFQIIIENYFTSYFLHLHKDFLLSFPSLPSVFMLLHTKETVSSPTFLKEGEIQFLPQLLNRMGFKTQARMVKCCKSMGRLPPLLTAFHIAEQFFNQLKLRPIQYIWFSIDFYFWSLLIKNS